MLCFVYFPLTTNSTYDQVFRTYPVPKAGSTSALYVDLLQFKHISSRPIYFAIIFIINGIIIFTYVGLIQVFLMAVTRFIICDEISFLSLLYP